MKKYFMILLVIIPVVSFAQSDLLNKFKNKVKNRAEQRTDEGMDKSIDAAENEVTKKPSSKKQDKKEIAEVEEGMAESKKNSGDTNKPNTGKPGSVSLKSYSRYDFIPGERIVYAEDFSQDVIGEMPLKWATDNRGETVSIETLPNQWLRLFPGGRFASPALQKLPENFTVEMDLMMQFNGEGGYVYPDLHIKLLELAQSDANARLFVQNQDAINEATLIIKPTGRSVPLNISLATLEKGHYYFTNDQKETKTMSDNAGKPIHIAVWVQKERVRYWINGDKVYDVPQAIPAAAIFNRIGFSLESSLYDENQLGIYVSNIKIAEGTADMRNKLVTEGKLVTHGILFDVNSDKIKPESAGVLKEIARVLKETPDLKVKIIGHTDSDGDETKNLDLSKRRSASVKSILVGEFGIDAARMETDGMGESKPVADNAKREGKSQNRRVEFIKF